MELCITPRRQPELRKGEKIKVPKGTEYQAAEKHGPMWFHVAVLHLELILFIFLTDRMHGWPIISIILET